MVKKTNRSGAQGGPASSDLRVEGRAPSSGVLGGLAAHRWMPVDTPKVSMFKHGEKAAFDGVGGQTEELRSRGSSHAFTVRHTLQDANAACVVQ
jgi:hypothetical protein